MKKSKVLYLVALFFLFITIDICYKNTVYANEKINKKNLITEIKDKNISLYYDKTSDGLLKGFLLKSGDNVKCYDWISAKQFYPDYPELSLLHDRYITVVCLEAEGTGLSDQKLYLIDKTTLKEQTYKNPIDVIKTNVNFNVKSPYVTIKIENNIWKTKVPNAALKHLFKTVEYGSVIDYDIEDNYFTVSVSAQITPATFIGDFKITYRWNKKMSKYTPTDINFNFNDIDIRSK